MEPVPAATRDRIVNGEIEIVASEIPVKGAVRFGAPAFVAGRAICFQTRGDRGLRFQRLLIETSALAAANVKSVGADRQEMSPFRHRVLHVAEPTERLQSGFDHMLIR